ncbi:DUF2341 domain-containing protein [Geobacter pelophilus]|uniref:DUF2341 domain-containing protein n=1 Tax=Geoanaerobacter pelophilus TaxID=60036 RepID=A0AAW4L4K9_9BACT|nr:MotA/TolQ/ExbB proton channel family protein [Geoanaerobacter pelophilus]MBT0666139.1 DUF2341 domain-containing protein [Geoanaerobacter pelophilus]
MIGCVVKRMMKGAALALLLTVALGATRADAWWDAKWEMRRKVAFDTTDKGANITDNLAELPVLVRLHSGNFTFEAAKNDGSDIRFVGSDDKTPLKYHLERFDAKQGIALCWVKVPQIAGKAAQDSVWLYYGNSSAASGADSGGTYDTAQAALFHFNEKEGVPKDATAYANHGAEFNGKLGAVAAIGNGALFSGAERLVVKRSPSLNLSKGFSFSAWVKPAQLGGEARLLSWDDGKESIVIAVDQGGAFARVGKAATGRTKPLAAGAWQHLAVTADPGKKLIIYLNGQEATTAALPASIPSPAAELAIGAGLDGKNGFNGELDEVGIASIPRPASWITAAVAGQGQDGKLATLMQEEAGKGGEGDLTIQLMKIIAKSITLDGWLIIGLCTSMLFLSVFVFVKKFLLLNKIQRDNQSFLEAFASNHDPLALRESEEDDFEHSSLYRIYRAGHDEIVNWLSRFEDSSEVHRLSPSVMNIYRASLDKASAKETQKLNAWLIVMTLSISGGPFWGLLGTVWGVMNTFAALAASGEANLSAIAPGVASALACTLFGLFVAIPALFAYSYLTMRMKIINSDTRIFIDELHVKIEGAYGESA